jgi:hypothetical protein
MFFKEIPDILDYTININEEEAQSFVQVIEDTEYLRDKLIRRKQSMRIYSNKRDNKKDRKKTVYVFFNPVMGIPPR